MFQAWHEGAGRMAADGSNVMRGRLISAGLSAMLASLGSVGPVNAWKIDEFSGYWTGTGEVTWTNGSTEQLKCVATYRNMAQSIRQNLRCASQGYSISATADLALTGELIAGKWEEKTYAANGDITGRVTEDGFTLSIRGPTFSADMQLSHTACKQAIDIAPTGVDVTRIKIGLGKC